MNKKSKFLFDVPFYRDWLFYIFLVFVIGGSSNALQRVSSSGGVNTSSFSLISGSIDAVFVVISAYIPILPMYFIRKFVRKRRDAISN